MYSIVSCACMCVCVCVCVTVRVHVMTGVSSTVGNDCESDLLKLHRECDPLGFQFAKFKDDLVHRLHAGLTP